MKGGRSPLPSLSLSRVGKLGQDLVSEQVSRAANFASPLRGWAVYSRGLLHYAGFRGLRSLVIFRHRKRHATRPAERV